MNLFHAELQSQISPISRENTRFSASFSVYLAYKAYYDIYISIMCFVDPNEEITEVATPVNPATELLKQGAGKE